MDLLARIKGLVLRGQYRLTRKAEGEMSDAGLTEPEVIESIINAPTIHKTLRSRSPARGRKRERVYVLQGLTFGGAPIYTKGALRRHPGTEPVFLLISAKPSIYSQ